MNQIDKIKSMKHEIANKFSNAQDIFELLGDETRIKIICMLLDAPNEEMKVEDITAGVYLSRPAVSHHLKALKEKGILSIREESRYNYYSINKNTDIWRRLTKFFIEVDDLLKMIDSTEKEL